MKTEATNIKTATLDASTAWAVIFAALVLASAIGVIYASHACRQLYIQMSALEQERNGLQVEWGRYLIERSAWASLSRVEQVATEELGMRAPETTEIVVVAR
ncbi:MAG: cell division protein FtsL [bacterium]